MTDEQRRKAEEQCDESDRIYKEASTPPAQVTLREQRQSERLKEAIRWLRSN